MAMILSAAALATGFVGLSALAAAQSSCDPIQTTCPAQPGLTSMLYTDFTQVSSLPSDWTLAAYETVNFGPNGAEFTFNKPPDAPYIWTTDYFLFGHVEVVLMAANGTGIISSVVMISDDLDEVDWEFSGNNFGSSSGVVQTNYFGKGITGSYDRGTQPSVSSPQTEWHTYTYDWSATSLTWSIDGTPVRTLLAADADDGSHQYPQTPVQLHLGLWDGGSVNNSADTVSWAGGYTDLSQAPFTMYVKSVKIVPANLCGSYTYGDMSGDWESIKCGNVSSGDDGATSSLTDGSLQITQTQTEIINTCQTAAPIQTGTANSSGSLTATSPTMNEAAASASASAEASAIAVGGNSRSSNSSSNASSNPLTGGSVMSTYSPGTNTASTVFSSFLGLGSSSMYTTMGILVFAMISGIAVI